jgi:hypothetical protein
MPPLCGSQVAGAIGTTVDQVWASLRYVAQSGKLGALGLSTPRLMEALDRFERGRRLHKLLTLVGQGYKALALVEACKEMHISQACGYRYLVFYQ